MASLFTGVNLGYSSYVVQLVWRHLNSDVKLQPSQPVLTTPPPNERSQFPMSVFATMRGMVSGWDHPTASTAMAMWAKGILSSRTRIWCNSKRHSLWTFYTVGNQSYNRLIMCWHEPGDLTSPHFLWRSKQEVPGLPLYICQEVFQSGTWPGRWAHCVKHLIKYRSHDPGETDTTTRFGLNSWLGFAVMIKTSLTSSSSQHYSGTFVVSGDVLHQVSSVDGPASPTKKKKVSFQWKSQTESPQTKDVVH